MRCIGIGTIEIAEGPWLGSQTARWQESYLFKAAATRSFPAPDGDITEQPSAATKITIVAAPLCLFGANLKQPPSLNHA